MEHKIMGTCLIALTLINMFHSYKLYRQEKYINKFVDEANDIFGNISNRLASLEKGKEGKSNATRKSTKD